MLVSNGAVNGSSRPLNLNHIQLYFPSSFLVFGQAASMNPFDEIDGRPILIYPFNLQEEWLRPQ